ncbi:MAG: hypothetical protein ACOYUZ_03415 [Patescibacteria group bacterium]
MTDSTNQISQITHDVHIPFRLSTDIRHGKCEEIKFIYRGGRIKYFLESQMSTAMIIGKEILYIYPTRYRQRTHHQDGTPCRLERSGDLANYFTSEVYLNWAFCEEASWHEIKMNTDPKDLKYCQNTREQPEQFTCLPLTDISGKSIKYYFRLVGRLLVSRETAAFLPHPDPNFNYYFSYDAEVKESEYYYEDGQLLATATVYDNPFGPYTNYQLKL